MMRIITLFLFPALVAGNPGGQEKKPFGERKTLFRAFVEPLLGRTFRPGHWIPVRLGAGVKKIQSREGWSVAVKPGEQSAIIGLCPRQPVQRLLFFDARGQRLGEQTLELTPLPPETALILRTPDAAIKNPRASHLPGFKKVRFVEIPPDALDELATFRETFHGILDEGDSAERLPDRRVQDKRTNQASRTVLKVLAEACGGFDGQLRRRMLGILAATIIACLAWGLMIGPDHPRRAWGGMIVVCLTSTAVLALSITLQPTARITVLEITEAASGHSFWKSRYIGLRARYSHEAELTFATDVLPVPVGPLPKWSLEYASGAWRFTWPAERLRIYCWRTVSRSQATGGARRVGDEIELHSWPKNLSSVPAWLVRGNRALKVPLPRGWNGRYPVDFSKALPWESVLAAAGRADRLAVLKLWRAAYPAPDKTCLLLPGFPKDKTEFLLPTRPGAKLLAIPLEEHIPTK